MKHTYENNIGKQHKENYMKITYTKTQEKHIGTHIGNTIRRKHMENTQRKKTQEKIIGKTTQETTQENNIRKNHRKTTY